MTTQTQVNKPSKQVEEVGKWWLKMVEAAPKHESLEAARDFGENWQSLTAEPGGVDYIETNAGGVPAMWAVPKGAVQSRGLPTTQLPQTQAPVGYYPWKGRFLLRLPYETIQS